MKVEIYDPDTHTPALEEFFANCGVDNNQSFDALCFNRRQDAMMTLVVNDNRILSMSYVHNFSEYYPGTYRALTRTATRTDARTAGVPRQRTMLAAAGLSALCVPLQVDYALSKNASDVLFTTNVSGGMSGSRKVDAFLKKIHDSDPRFSYVEERQIYGCVQSVWRLNYRDIINLADPI